MVLNKAISLSSEFIMKVEDAYKLLAEGAIEEAGSTRWDRIVIEIKIYEKMASFIYWCYEGDKKIQGNGSVPIDMKARIIDAVLFIRDDLIETTGDRIWGMEFSLTNEGKFNIEYSYTKPNGF